MELDILAVAGNHHKTGQTSNAINYFRGLKEFLAKSFNIDDIEYHWSAQHYQPVDKIPYIGLLSHHNKNIYIATGYFADGLVYGIVAGRLVADLINGVESPWHKIYNSNRFTPCASASSFIKENINVFLQYMKDFPGRKDAKSIEEISNGQGKVIECSGEKIAVYRDLAGKVHPVSAVCTHMKGIVNWNNAEKTWDCPCHGSRFSYEGKVLEGPAIFPLERKKI